MMTWRAALVVAGLGAITACGGSGSAADDAVGATTGGVQDALGDHEGGAVVHLLAGLEHEDHVAAQLVAAVGEQAGGAGTSTASSRREPWPSAATWRTTPPTGR